MISIAYLLSINSITHLYITCDYIWHVLFYSIVVVFFYALLAVLEIKVELTFKHKTLTLRNHILINKLINHECFEDSSEDPQKPDEISIVTNKLEFSFEENKILQY